MARKIVHFERIIILDVLRERIYSWRMVKVKNADKAIGARLKALREAKGIRQNFVADKLGISNNFLSELESGKKRWFAALVYKYERIVNP